MSNYKNNQEQKLQGNLYQDILETIYDNIYNEVVKTQEKNESKPGISDNMSIGEEFTINVIKNKR